jgi:Sec-independent protein secretion pathway component TatC
MSLQSEIDKKVTQYYHNNDTTEPGLEDIIKLQKTYNNKIASYLEYITPTNIPKTLSNKSIAKIETNLTISDYIDWLIFFTCIIGLVFELPMIMVLLTIIRVTNDKTFSKVRPYALIIILIIGAVIAPDVVTQIFVSIPIYLLYEVGIIASFIVRKRQEKTAAAA